MSKKFDIFKCSSFLEEELCVKNINLPFFKIPTNFRISVTFPYAGAASRFLLKRKDREEQVSFYLDTQDVLGAVGEPYWEALIGHETHRCSVNDIQSLINMAEIYINHLCKEATCQK